MSSICRGWRSVYTHSCNSPSEMTCVTDVAETYEWSDPGRWCREHLAEASPRQRLRDSFLHVASTATSSRWRLFNSRRLLLALLALAFLADELKVLLEGDSTRGQVVAVLPFAGRTVCTEDNVQRCQYQQDGYWHDCESCTPRLGRGEAASDEGLVQARLDEEGDASSMWMSARTGCGGQTVFIPHVAPARCQCVGRACSPSMSALSSMAVRALRSSPTMLRS